MQCRSLRLLTVVCHTRARSNVSQSIVRSVLVVMEDGRRSMLCYGKLIIRGVKRNRLVHDYNGKLHVVVGERNGRSLSILYVRSTLLPWWVGVTEVVHSVSSGDPRAMCMFV
jgi:hypothetical protein